MTNNSTHSNPINKASILPTGYGTRLPLLTLALILTAMLLSGCVFSTNPLYTADSIVYNDALVGTWGSPEDSAADTGMWNFEKRGNDRYLLTMIEGGDNVGYFEAVLTTIGDDTFLDIFPLMEYFDELNAISEPEGGEMFPRTMFYMIHMGPEESLPLHSTYRFSLEGDSFSMQNINPQWFEEKQMSESPLEHHPDEEMIVTSSTEELREFYSGMLGDEAAWGEATMMLRQKAAVAAPAAQ